MNASERWSIACEDRDFPEWHQGCGWCAAWVLLLDAPAVRHAITLARARLGHVLLPRYERQAHLTIAYRGLCAPEPHPAQEYDGLALREDIGRLQDLGQPPFDLQLAGAQSFETVPYLAVNAQALRAPPGISLTATNGQLKRHEKRHPGTAKRAPQDHPIQRLHAALQPISAEALQSHPTYVPHVTIGHYAQRVSLQAAIHQMKLARWQSPRMLVKELTLVRYASHDMAGPLVLEGRFCLATGRYQPAPGAFWPANP